MLLNVPCPKCKKPHSIPLSENISENQADFIARLIISKDCENASDIAHLNEYFKGKESSPPKPSKFIGYNFMEPITIPLIDLCEVTDAARAAGFRVSGISLFKGAPGMHRIDFKPLAWKKGQQ